MNAIHFLHQISESIETALLYLLCFSALMQAFYYLFFYVRIFFLKTNQKVAESFREPVSIIIAAHNEAENLKRFLPSILKQDYPKFEVIVINDRSEDDTDTVLAEFKRDYPFLKTTFIKNNGKIQYGKKLALTLGIKAALYDYVLLTDADCQASTDQWINRTVSDFHKKEIVLSYGPYFEEKSFLNRLIRYETFFIAMQYLSFAKAGFPYMGIGRNLAYKKDLFVNNRGIASHAHLNSGDDDLFINEVAQKGNVAISTHPDSFVYSVAKNTFAEWVGQKQRHLTTFPSYKKIHQVLLSGELFSRVLFYLLFFALMISNSSNYYFWAIVTTRMLMVFVILFKSTLVFKEKKLGFVLLLFDFISPIINFYIYYRTKK